MKIEFSRQIFKKYSDIGAHDDLSSESLDLPCGRTGGHDKALRNFAKAP
jgi:hypothetical protein